MKKKLPIFVILALTVTMTAGCDGFASFFKKKEQTPTEQKEEEEQTPQVIHVESIVLQDQGVTLQIGEKHQIVASVSPADATNKEIIYRSEDSHKCSVSSTGLVTAYESGNVNVKVSSKENSAIFANFSVTINAKQNFTVSFESNGGSGTMSQQMTEGSTYTTPNCEFTYEDHTFLSWALGSTDGERYSAGQTITNITSNITLYATWKSNSGGDLDGYYDSIGESLSGDDLLLALNTLNTQKRTSFVTYAGMRQFAAVCDADPDGSGKIIGFYDNKKVGPDWDGGSTWNREHVWPNVRGGSAVEGDAHMTRPASTSTNSDRGSKGFGYESYDPGQFVAYYRGVASRIIFYAAMADISLSLIDDPLNYDGCYNEHKKKMGCLSDMLQWNLQYLPSDTSFTGDNDLARRTELSRNEAIQNHADGQGNRNPFIDHPEYACKIWGNTNSKTKSICGISN